MRNPEPVGLHEWLLDRQAKSLDGEGDGHCSGVFEQRDLIPSPNKLALLRRLQDAQSPFCVSRIVSCQTFGRPHSEVARIIVCRVIVLALHSCTFLSDLMRKVEES